ncbi:MAG: leucine-rich repeat domain-containing protein [Prevotella sp.]|nr:leucine-rich repeat domain-containing protein [Prevotella sp.]
MSFMLVCLSSLTVLAADFTVDEINYNITSSEKLTVEVTSGISYQGDVVIPDKVEWNGNEYRVTSIGWYAFYSCSSLTSVDIPNSVTSIGHFAFKECKGLTSITIPNSVTSIERWAFTNCSSLTSITIPNSVTSIEGEPFSGCSGLTSIIVENGNTVYDSRVNCNAIIETETNKLLQGCMNTKIPNSVTSIGFQAFWYCSGLTSISIPNSVTSIEEQAFYECSGLTSITIPNSVTSIGRFVFMNCSGLTSVTIPNSLTSIEEYAFCGCRGLTSVTIPYSVTNIGGSAFSGCSGLTSITIPNSVTSIGSSVFSRCSGLISMIVEDGNTVYDSRDNSNAIIETEKNELIDGCKNTIIPNTVTSIGFAAFSGCNGLTSISIPNSVTSIENDAFRNCSGLTEVISLVSDPFPTNATQSIWYGVNTSEIPLYVPVGTKELYEATEGWNVFTNIIERGISVAGDDGGVDYANNPDINQDTDLNGNVVGNIFYNISDGNGEYSSAEGCIVLRKTTSDEQVDNMVGLDLFGEDVKNNYTGIIFMVQQGSGTVKVNAETTGNMTLKVKVGNGQPVEMVFSGKLEVTVPYAVSEPSYVYIYGGEKTTANAKAMGAKSAADNALKIYGIEWSKQDITTVMDIANEEELVTSPIYNLNGQRVATPQKGNIYIMNGKKVVVK